MGCCIVVFQQLESLSWHSNGEEFKSAHSDGSYIIWSATDSSNAKEPALTPYGENFKDGVCHSVSNTILSKYGAGCSISYKDSMS